MPGGTVLSKLRNFLYMHAGTENGFQNVILLYNEFLMQIFEFFRTVHINMLIFTLNGWN